MFYVKSIHSNINTDSILLIIAKGNLVCRTRERRRQNNAGANVLLRIFSKKLAAVYMLFCSRYYIERTQCNSFNTVDEYRLNETLRDHSALVVLIISADSRAFCVDRSPLRLCTFYSIL